MPNHEEALRQIETGEAEERQDRAQRLAELVDLLPTEDTIVGFSGQGSVWLFDDIKATWIYGYFASTIVTAHAFCILQLASRIRLRIDDPDLTQLPDGSLEKLAAVAAGYGLIEVELQSQLVVLHDLYNAFTDAPLNKPSSLLEDHLADSEMVSREPPLLADARHALLAAIECLSF